MSRILEEIKVDLKHNTGDFEVTQTGDIKRVSGIKNIEQAMLHRLITVKGSLAHRPDYGVGVQLWQGAVNNIDQKRNLALTIQEQFVRDERIVSVDSVRFEVSDLEPDKFLIFVKYTAVGYNELEATLDPFDLEV